MDYGYINARLRAMRSRLLERRILDDLILQPDIDSLMGVLEKTPYRDDIAEAKALCSGVLCIESAMRKNFVNTFRKILEFSGETEAKECVTCFLHRWDVQNIKTILRGKNIHVTNEEILDCLVPAGELDEATVIELVRQPDTRAVIDMLATWNIGYAKPLTEGYPCFLKNGDLAILECALDKYYYAEALRAVKSGSYNDRMIRNQISLEIDIVNIKTLLRMIRDHIEEEEALSLFLDGGKEFDRKRLTELLALRSIGDVIAQLKETPYGVLSDLQETAVKTGKISVIEKELERLLIQKGSSAFKEDPLSVAPLIGYFWAKHNEITNIRIIARCKTADFPIEQVREELVYV